jgi:cytochrome P450
MLASFTHNGDGIPSTPGDEPVVENLVFWLKAITINILSGASFNLHIPWPTKSILASNELEVAKPAVSPACSDADSDAHQRSWLYCMNTIMEHFYFLIGLSSWTLEHLPWKFLRELPSVHAEFLDYIEEMIDDAKYDGNDEDDEGTPKPDESAPISSTKPHVKRNDLLNNILRANKNDQLDDSEILGNICILLIAGHETSASVLETALILLATEPAFQQTIQAEIDSIWASKLPGEDLTYEDYPKMERIMALMLETLRLYPPIINLFKSTLYPQTLSYRDQDIPIPADTTIFLEAVSLHRNPKYWSPSPDTFLPSRWLKDLSYTPPPNTLSESPAHKNLLCPVRGSFIPFGAGMRSCLGKKFAQVEFCTIVAVLLRECSVELVDDGDGKGWEEKKREALECLGRRRTIIALRMLGKVRVRFVKRGFEAFPPREGKEEVLP